MGNDDLSDESYWLQGNDLYRGPPTLDRYSEQDQSFQESYSDTEQRLTYLQPRQTGSRESDEDTWEEYKDQPDSSSVSRLQGNRSDQSGEYTTGNPDDQGNTEGSVGFRSTSPWSPISPQDPSSTQFSQGDTASSGRLEQKPAVVAEVENYYNRPRTVIDGVEEFYGVGQEESGQEDNEKGETQVNVLWECVFVGGIRFCNDFATFLQFPRPPIPEAKKPILQCAESTFFQNLDLE